MTDRDHLEPEIDDLEEPEPADGPAPSIQQVLDATEQLRGASSRPAVGARTMVGEVLEVASPDHPGRTLVGWRDEDDRVHEGWLATIRGLSLRPGDRVLLNKPGNWTGWIVAGAIQQGAAGAEVSHLDAEESEERLHIEIDGQRVTVEGRDEVVIRCGKASITLRRNGRIVIRGTYVESRSKGTNRIKGGSVQIN